MPNHLNRRDFVKLVTAGSLGLFTPRWMQRMPSSRGSEEQKKNIILILFDAFSAADISLYGYQRQTTPNMDRLAKRAIVYHNHYAGGNFTTPGTASLLTGVLPWSHRALNLNEKVQMSYEDKSIFHLLSDYYGIAYTHNRFANTLLKQFSSTMEELIPRESLFLESYDRLISTLFHNDDDISSIAWIRNMQFGEEGTAYSLFLSHLYQQLQEWDQKRLHSRFPRGLPLAGFADPFVLETAIQQIGTTLTEIPRPFLGYFHFLPPHEPYRTETQFIDAFKNDGFKAIDKPPEILAKKIMQDQPKSRREYDEYILYCDQELGKFFDRLESSGILENSWVILTSDHGEMFERGINGHGSRVLYQPVIRIPLLIFEPGRQQGMDIFDPSSAVDLLPTIAHIAGKNAPQWTEGRILPPFAPPDAGRSIYAVQALDTLPNEPLTDSSLVLIHENYKLHYYRYSELLADETVKLFDLKSDPEEMTDLFDAKQATALELLDELKTKLKQVNEPYVAQQ